MKKLLLLLVVATTLFMASCTGKTDTQNLTIRQELLDVIKQFGKVRYEDLQYDNSEAITYGSAYMTMGEKDDEITIVRVTGNTYVLVEIVLDPGTSLTTEVWNVMITYTNRDLEIYVELDYYFYGMLLKPNYSAVTVEKRFKTWVGELHKLSLEDIEWIIVQLGYKIMED